MRLAGPAAMLDFALAPASDDALAVRADPSALACVGDLLFVAETTGAIVEYCGARHRRIADLELVTTDTIGGIAHAPDGTLYVTRVGNGEAGAILRVDPAGQVRTLPWLPVAPYRSGIAYDAAAHVLYTTQYVKSRSGASEGAIVECDPDTGAPSMVLDGFLHPVAIAKLGSILVVTDARQRAVFRVELSAGRAVRRLQLATGLGRPYGVCGFDADSVIVSSRADDGAGELHRIWLDGQTAQIARGSWDPRGVASDGASVFVATVGQLLSFRP
ncbi:MAG: hypothetical protein WKG01_30985 [Kofleriaceae bacterium]